MSSACADCIVESGDDGMVQPAPGLGDPGIRSHHGGSRARDRTSLTMTLQAPGISRRRMSRALAPRCLRSAMIWIRRGNYADSQRARLTPGPAILCSRAFEDRASLGARRRLAVLASSPLRIVGEIWGIRAQSRIDRKRPVLPPCGLRQPRTPASLPARRKPAQLGPGRRGSAPGHPRAARP